MYTLMFGNKNYSSWSLRSWIFLKQNQIDFIEHKVAMDLSDPYTHEDLKPYFSNYKVPLLLDGDFQVWDSLAIMEYLADSVEGVDAWPEDVKARAVARSVSAEMHSSFGALREALPMNCRVFYKNYPINEAVQKDVQRIEDLWEYCGQYKTDGDWLFGAFSIVDAMYAPIVLRLVGYDVTLGENAQKYVDFVMESPHIRAWVASAKEETEVIPEDEV